VSVPAPLRGVPPLGELLADASALDRLHLDALVELKRQAAHLTADITAAIDWRMAGARPEPQGPDRAVGLEEASGLLGLSRDFLYRHWKKLGGYKDDDGRVRFTMSTIQRRLQHQARR
jgi:hypothetical protein